MMRNVQLRIEAGVPDRDETVISSILRRNSQNCQDGVYILTNNHQLLFFSYSASVYIECPIPIAFEATLIHIISSGNGLFDIIALSSGAGEFVIYANKVNIKSLSSESKIIFGPVTSDFLVNCVHLRIWSEREICQDIRDITAWPLLIAIIDRQEFRVLNIFDNEKLNLLYCYPLNDCVTSMDVHPNGILMAGTWSGIMLCFDLKGQISASFIGSNTEDSSSPSKSPLLIGVFSPLDTIDRDLLDQVDTIPAVQVRSYSFDSNSSSQLARFIVCYANGRLCECEIRKNMIGNDYSKDSQLVSLDHASMSVEAYLQFQTDTTAQGQKDEADSQLVSGEIQPNGFWQNLVSDEVYSYDDDIDDIAPLNPQNIAVATIATTSQDPLYTFSVLASIHISNSIADIDFFNLEKYKHPDTGISTHQVHCDPMANLQTATESVTSNNHHAHLQEHDLRFAILEQDGRVLIFCDNNQSFSSATIHTDETSASSSSLSLSLLSGDHTIFVYDSSIDGAQSSTKQFCCG